MAIEDFSENEIRKKLLNKVDPGKINKKGKHWKGYIYHKDKLVAKIKIPNDHKRIMKEKKSQYIARDLKLSDSEFNDLIKCPLKGKDYYKILDKLQ